MIWNRSRADLVDGAVFGEPFVGSAAIARRAVTADELRGPRFRRLYHDVHVAAEVDVDLTVLSHAAHLLVDGRGVLCGYSAAELLGASCGRAGCAAEVHVPGGRQRAQRRLRVHRGRLHVVDVTTVHGMAVTTPLRTAYDLGRRKPLVEAVVAVDALAHAHPFDLRALLTVARRYPGARGNAQLPETVRLADRRAESPMESRIRLAILADGLPVPALQYPVGPYLLDLAYPAVRLGIEYDGREHLEQARARRDLSRQASLTAAGWTILRFDAPEVLHRPTRVAATVRGELILIGRRRGLGMAEVVAMITATDT